MHVLLQTKLFRPPLPVALVPRPRLDHQAPAARLTLVAAPAGSGKTTLVAAWLHHRAVAWLTLDEHDNHVDQFMAYLVAAIQTIEPTLGRTAQTMLEAGPLRDATPVVSALLNDLARSAHPFTLVLDDYHLITERRIHQALTLLIDRAPSHVHLVLITRHDPPLPFARWRVRAQLAEVRAADLRFTSDEAARFLATTMQLALSDAATQMLEQRTEGWVAGLQLAALSLRGRPDAEALVARFDGSDRFVADYLIEEVLSQQPEEIRLFLLHTAVLQRFSAELCAELLAELAPIRAAGMVTDAATCQARIAALDAANLFVVPLDSQRVWYRYHQLFADLLRTRLRRDDPALWRDIHRRASQWHERADLLDTAMHYAHAANDHVRVAELIEQQGLRLIGDGLMRTLLIWMEHLPQRSLTQRPLVYVVCAWACVLSQQTDRAEQFLKLGEQQITGYVPVTFARDGTLFSSQELEAHLLGLRAFIADSRNQFAHAIDLAQQALAGLPAHVTIIHAPLYLLVGRACMVIGQLDRAEIALREAVRVAIDGNIRYIAISARSLLADLLTNTGALAEAQRVYNEAIAVGSPPRTPQPLPPVAYPMLNLAWMHYRWNDLPTTDTYLADAETLAQQGEYTSVIVWVLLLRVRRYSSAGQFTFAANGIAQVAALLAKDDRVATNQFDLALARARLALYQGRLDEAAEQLQHCGVTFTAFQTQDVRGPAGHQFFVQHQDWLPLLGHILLAQERFAALDTLTAWLGPAAATTQYMVVRIQAALLRALAHQAQGHFARAQAALTDALTLAAPRNLQRVLIEFGVPLVAPLRQALAANTYAPFVQQVLAAPEYTHFPVRSATSPNLPEPLTERETQVLRLLASGMNSTEIAAQLIIAPSTVRTYIKSLYGKLDVNRRHDAIERARALRLL